jgi:hypothetical protein
MFVLPFLRLMKIEKSDVERQTCLKVSSNKLELFGIEIFVGAGASCNVLKAVTTMQPFRATLQLLQEIPQALQP